MRGTVWETFEDFEVEAVRGLVVLMLEVIVSERVSAAGLKVSSMAGLVEAHASEEEEMY